MATVPSRMLQVDCTAEPRRPLKIAVAYEGFESGLQAAQVYRHLVEMLDEDYAFEVDFWRFEVLKVPSIGELAARKATEADLVMIAVDGNAMLPVDFQLWVEKWIEGKVGQDSALVFVSKSSSQSANASALITGYLREVALRGNMAFISDSTTIAPQNTFEGRADRCARIAPVGMEAILTSRGSLSE